MSVSPIDLALGTTVLITALVALVPRSRLVLVMAFLGFGTLIAMVWIRLDALDVALAEAALGAGLLSGIQVWLAVRSPEPPGAGGVEPSPRLPWVRPALGVTASAMLAVSASAVWLRTDQQLPHWEEPLESSIPATGVEHGITGVLLAFRAYDTLLESAILMLTAVAVLALSRDGGLSAAGTRRLGMHRGHPAWAPPPPVPSTLVWVIRVIAPALLLLGLWLLFAGSTDSGGAFQSGAVLAAVLILLRTAHVDLSGFTAYWLRPMLVVGVVVFILAGLLGPLLGMPWLSWDPAWAFAAVLTVEVLLTAGIATGLYLLFLTLENPEGVR